MFGCHIYKKGTLAESIKANIKLSKYGLPVSSAQFFARNPRGYDSLLSQKDIAELKEIPIEKIIHANYPAVINGKPASTQQIAENCRVAAEIGGSVVVHFPSCETPNEKDNLIISVIRQARSIKPSTIYLEVEVSKGYGYCTIAELDQFFSASIGLHDANTGLHNANTGLHDANTSIGLCVDTAHLWGMGISTRTRAEAEEYLAGLSMLRKKYNIKIMFHLNDSLVGLGSRVDRHAVFETNIWDGDTSGLEAIIEWAKANNSIVILETRETPAAQLQDYMKILELSR